MAVLQSGRTRECQGGIRRALTIEGGAAMNRRRVGVVEVVLLGVVVLALSAGANLFAQEGFKPLFNGKDLSGFKTVPAELDKAITVKDQTIIVPGKPNGYFYTEKPYKNYVLKFDWKYVRPPGLADDSKFGGNSGLLVHIQGDHKVWPKCVEVQGMNRDHGNIFAIGGAKGNFKKFADAQKKAIKPVGEWNTTEVTSDNGKLTAKVNGELVSEGTGELTEGPIGWQSEGAEIHFRKIEIKEMK
jgi:hypothetical protein